jgi:hypothetical protein
MLVPPQKIMGIKYRAVIIARSFSGSRQEPVITGNANVRLRLCAVLP